MAKNEYVIYQCLGETSEGKKLERIFKLPSFWASELLGVALTTLSDNIVEITIINENAGYKFSFSEKTYGYGAELRDLEDSSLEFILKDINNKTIHFKCKKIGIDKVKNTITRTTPIIVSCNDVKDAENRVRMLFNIQKELFIYD